MSKLVQSIMGRLYDSPEGADPSVFKALKSGLEPLNEIESGLAKRAAGFVCTGEDSAVLLTLHKHSGEVVQNLLQVNGYRWAGSKRSWPLDALLAREGYWDPAIVLRLGQLYATAETALAGATWGYCGTKAGSLWLRLLLTVTERATPPAFTEDRKNRAPFGQFTVARCRELLRLADEPDDGLLDILFHRSAQEYRNGHCLDRLPGAEDYLKTEPDSVMAAAKVLDAIGRIELLRAIGRFGLTDAYLGYVFAQGTGSAKSVREAALAALQGASADRLLAKAAEVFEGGAAAARGNAASLIALAAKERARPLLEAQLEKEKGQRVRETIRAALTTLALTDEEAAAGTDVPPAGQTAGPESLGAESDAPANGGFIALDGSAVDLPPLPPMPERTPIPGHLFDHLQRTMTSFNQALEVTKKANAKEKYHWSRHWQPLTAADLENFKALLEEDGNDLQSRHRHGDFSSIDARHCPMDFDRTGIEAFFAAPEVTAWHLLGLYQSRFWSLFFLLSYAQGRLSGVALQKRLQDGIDFRILAKMHAERGGSEPLWNFLATDYRHDLEDAPFDDVWIYCAEHLALIDEALGMTPQSGDRPLIPLAGLEVLERFPKVPKRYLLPLMGLATGARKTLREPARRLLAGAPQIDDAIAAQLKDAKQDVRAGAADWLADRGAERQVPALKAALKKEKSEVARAAMLTALDRLGEDLSAYFDAGTLLAEAEAGLAKVNLKSLEWFPLDALPRVTWRDGTPLDPKVLTWWIALANKLKQPGGNALFELYLDRLTPEDSERLGLFLLRTWIGHDTVHPSDAEANDYAKAHADGHYKMMARWDDDYTREKAFSDLRAQKKGEYLQSANANKGLLGLAARAPGADAAEAARSYLKNHGARIAQCKAILDCLAANPAPAAIQVVLAVSNRFKAKTVQAHAQALIEEIAERRGWTADQLADRTIPTGGLDETGTMELDCGDERIYRARLADDGKLVLSNPAGKEVKALPSARNEEEGALIKAAKKALSGGRKEIKQVDAMQAGRLFEAMCLERSWSPEEWQRYLSRHPIVGRMCQRLVWLGCDRSSEVAASFRPLEDGSLSGPADETVTLEDVAGIKLAHQTLMGEAATQAWLTHLADYEIAPLFDQFTRPLLKPGDEQARSSEVTDRRGHMIESFKLRGAATKLGFQRGQAEDGGVFCDYVKRYDGIGIAAIISFTGSPLPEENIACALLSLSFNKIRKKTGQWGAAIPLNEVPPVLLSETWNDYHQIAAAGTGFDPDWEKKVEYW